MSESSVRARAVSDNITLAGAVDDIRGLGVAVYQDHQGIRIDVAGHEIMLDPAGSRALRDLLIAAEVEARFWHMTNDVPEVTGE